MTSIPFLALVADTVLVRPVGVPTPWYSVASGVLSIVVTLLLLGIAVALLGMARALKGAESRLGGSMKGLTEELLPLARNLNQIAVQLSDVTVAVRGDLQKISGTIGAVDDAVRDALDAGEARLGQLGTLVDAVQDEAQAVVGSATGMMRGMRAGAGTLAKSFFARSDEPRPARRRRPVSRPVSRPAAAADERTALELEESEILARLAALEAAFAVRDGATDDEAHHEDEVAPVRRNGAANPFASVPVDDEHDDEYDDDDDDDDDDGPDDDIDGDDDDDDERDDADDLDDDADDDDDFDDHDEDDEDDDDGRDSDDEDAPVGPGRMGDAPRTGGPRIRQDRRA